MLTGDAAVNSGAPIICCTAEVLANIALREGADADVGQVVMDEFHFYAEPERGWAWQVPLLSLPHAQFLLMSATLGDVAALREDLTRRTGRETAARRRRRAARAARLLLVAGAAARAPRGARAGGPRAGLRRALHAGLGARARAGARVGEAVHARGAGGDRRRDRRLPLHRRVRPDAVAAHPQRHRRPPRRHAAALPPAGGAAGPDRAAEGDLRDGHARRRHQRPDPHRGLHRAGQVRRLAAADPEGARVPSDRRARRARRVRHRRLRGGAGARARDREGARGGQGRRRPEEAAQAPALQAGGRRGRLDRGDVRAPAQRDARGAGLADARQPRDDPQRHQPARGSGGDAARADGGQPRGRARPRAPRRAGPVAERGAARLRRARGAGRARRARPDAAAGARAAGRLRAQPAAGLVRAGRVRPDRPRGRRPTRSTCCRSSSRSSTTRRRS